MESASNVDRSLRSATNWDWLLIALSPLPAWCPKRDAEQEAGHPRAAGPAHAFLGHALDTAMSNPRDNFYMMGREFFCRRRRRRPHACPTVSRAAIETVTVA